MNGALQLHLHRDGRWRVLDAGGAELTATGGPAAAVSWAIAYLHENGGGTYCMRTADGVVAAPVRVAGKVDWQKPAKDLGQLADQMMGRHDPPDPNADISGIEITSTNKTVKLINTHV